jgi:hypothetical protein
MPEIADPPALSCSLLLPAPEIQQNQPLAPDLFPLRTHDARGRFAPGHSGNPAGRPPGIPNPKRRVLDLRARKLSPGALSALLDRKPWLLRPLLTQVLPPPAAWFDPAAHLGIRLSALRTAEDFERAAGTVWAAVLRGEIGPADAVRLMRLLRRTRTRLRRLRRKQRLARGPA